MTAKYFFHLLPASRALPKISPDGEGGLMMIWECNGNPLLVTVDNRRLHAVTSATTPRAQYHDDVPFDDVSEIPQVILDAIPAN